MSKTVEIVKTAKGWHVTRRYCGRTVASAFFAITPEKQTKKALKEATEKAEAARDAYVQEWVSV